MDAVKFLREYRRMCNKHRLNYQPPTNYSELNDKPSESTYYSEYEKEQNEKSNLLEIHKGLEKINTAQKELQENYENKRRILQAQKKELERRLQYETDGINSNRIDNAKRFICIEGLENFGRGETRLCIGELISDLVNDNYKILKEYYGCKNYDGFICQRSDHRYGYGPTHGYIVFSIRATQDFREGIITPNEKDKNDILYMLENVKNHKIKE